MLRVTVTRESATESQPIAEVVIGKFAGSEQRGGYAARVFEPPSPYSEGVDACFAVRGHERYQPAFALVASVLQAWREGRVDEVGEGVRAVLTNASRPLDAPPPPPPVPVDGTADPLLVRAAQLLLTRGDDPALRALAEAVVAVADR